MERAVSPVGTALMFVSSLSESHFAALRCSNFEHCPTTPHGYVECSIENYFLQEIRKFQRSAYANKYLIIQPIRPPQKLKVLLPQQDVVIAQRLITHLQPCSLVAPAGRQSRNPVRRKWPF
eukprot:1195858-Prorocentrum_minimum.AAC.6